MCLIAHREVRKGGRGSNIPNEVIEYNRRKNPDGFGIAWRQGKEVLHQKFAPSDHAAFEKLLKTIDKQPHIEYVAHWRLATHGDACEELSHPFSYEDEAVGQVLVFHNGIIDIDVPKKGKKSDTSAFVEQVLSKLVSKWWEKPAYKFLVTSSIGWSRLLLMTPRKTVRLTGSNPWKSLGGIWYSVDPLPSWTSTQKAHSGYATYGRTPTNVYTMFDDDDAESYMDWQNKWEEAKRVKDMLDENDPDDGEETDFLLPEGKGVTGLLKAGSIHHVRALDGYLPQNGWLDNGDHWISPIKEDEGGGTDYSSGQAICETCQTVGMYYVIEGTKFSEVPHKYVTSDGETKLKSPTTLAEPLNPVKVKA